MLLASTCLFGLPLLAPPVQAQPTMEEFRLRLPHVLDSSRSQLAKANLPLLVVMTVLTVYGATISMMHILWRRRKGDELDRLNRDLREAQERVERAHLFLAADRQFMVTWNGLEDADVSFEGDITVALETTNPMRALNFREWLSPLDADALMQRLQGLRSAGTAFSLAFRTLAGEHVDIEGRPVAGRAVMAVRLSTGERAVVARMQAENQALAEAQGQLCSVLNAIPQPVWLRDRAGRLGWVNSAYAQAVDAAGPDAVLSAQAEILDTQDRAEIRKVQRDSGHYHGEVTAILAGQRRKVDVVEVAGPEGGGGFAFDISELEAARAALERQMEAHVKTLDELPNAVAMFDQRQLLTYSNRAFADLFALDAGFLKNRPSVGEWLDALRVNGRLPETGDYRQWKASQIALFASPESSEHGWRLSNGRALRLVASPNPQGGLTFLFEDETERFALATEFDQLKNTQWETLMALSEGVAVFSSDGCLQLSNPAFAKLWDISPEALRSRLRVEEVAQAANRQAAPAWHDITRTVCSLSEARDERHFETATSDARVFRISTVPLPERATLVTVSDVTDTVEAEARLREHNDALTQAARLRTDFIRSLSFELRSPLTNVVLAAQALAGGVAGDLSPKQRSYTEDLARSADSVLAITNDVLDLADLESGSGVDLKREDFGLSEAITESLEGLQDRIGAANLKLALNVQSGIKVINADPKHFRHILFNLLANAISFSGDGDHLRLAVRRESANLIVEVSDSGRGAPGSSTREVPREHGFRFSLARALVQLHDGNIEVTQDHAGGHVTTVILPGA